MITFGLRWKQTMAGERVYISFAVFLLLFLWGAGYVRTPPRVEFLEQANQRNVWVWDCRRMTDRFQNIYMCPNFWALWGWCNHLSIRLPKSNAQDIEKSALCGREQHLADCLQKMWQARLPLCKEEKSIWKEDKFWECGQWCGVGVIFENEEWMWCTELLSGEFSGIV